MKKFMLATALSCFCTIVCFDGSVNGMQNDQSGNTQGDQQQLTEPQRLFQQNDCQGLFEWFDRNYDGDDINIFDNDRDTWLNLINRYVGDEQYTDILNLIVLMAAVPGDINIARTVLQGNATTSCDRLFDSTAIHEAAEHGNVTMLNMFLEKRPNSEFALRNTYGFTPLDRAIIGESNQAVEWFLNLYDTTGKDIGLSHRNGNKHTVLGSAVDGDSLEIVRLLINHHDSNGNYDISVQDPDDKSSNVLVQALLYGNDDVINIVLDSGRVSLDTVIDTLKLNKTYRSLSRKIMTRLRNMAIGAELPGVLGALDVYDFWQALDSGDEGTAIRLFNSENFDANAVAQAIASDGLKLKEESYLRIPDVVANKQLILSALDIYNFRKALKEEKLSSMQLLLTSGRVNFDNIVAILNSSKNLISPPIYSWLAQTAQNTQRQDVIQALQELDSRVFHTVFHGDSLNDMQSVAQVLMELNYNFFQPVIDKNDQQIIQMLLTSGRVSLDVVIDELNLSSNELPEQIYLLIFQMAKNSKRQDVIQALRELDRRVFQAMVDSYAWQDMDAWQSMIRLWQIGRIVLSSQEYNDIRRSIADDLQQEANRDEQQTLQQQINQLDFYFLRSSFILQKWDELPNLLN